MDEHVFIIENNRQIVDALTYVFDDAGIIVDSAYSYQEAMDTALECEYDCLLIDVKLDNGKTGIDFAYEYLSVYPEARIIIITALDSIPNIRSDFKYERIVKKPFDYPELISIIRNPPAKEFIDTSGRLICLLEESIKQNKTNKTPTEDTRKIEVYKAKDRFTNKIFFMSVFLIVLIAILYMIVR